MYNRYSIHFQLIYYWGTFQTRQCHSMRTNVENTIKLLLGWRKSEINIHLYIILRILNVLMVPKAPTHQGIHDSSETEGVSNRNDEISTNKQRLWDVVSSGKNSAFTALKTLFFIFVDVASEDLSSSFSTKATEITKSFETRPATEPLKQGD